MNIKLNDLKKGLESEISIKPIIEKYFNVKINKLKGYNILDFVDESGCYYEIKSRNCNKDTYDTTMIGYNKIIEIKKLGCKCIFIFMFYDGNYYYEFDENDKRLIISDGGRKDRGRIEIKKYCYIPVFLLRKL